MSFDDAEKSVGGGVFFKLVDKERVTIHVIGETHGGITEPNSARQAFNRTIKRGIAVPENYSGPLDAPWKHSFIVWSFRDEAPAVWTIGSKLCKQMKGILDSYDGSWDDVDIVVARQGVELATTYTLSPKQPSKFDPAVLDGVVLPNMDEINAIGSEEDITNLENGIAPERNGASAAADTTETAVETVDDATTTEEAVAEEPAVDDAVPAEEVDEEAALLAQVAAIKAKKAAALKANGNKGGGTATLAKPKPGVTVAKPGVKPVIGDQRIALVRAVTAAFAKNSKRFGTPAARMAAIKKVSKASSTLSQLTIAELMALKKQVG